MGDEKGFHQLVHEVIHSFCGFLRWLLRSAISRVLQVFTRRKKRVELRAPQPAIAYMNSRVLPARHRAEASHRLPIRLALWLLDRPRLGHHAGIKHFAGRLLKRPARQGVVVAQSRLGQMLCRDCGNARDRRIGLELLRQAARAGDMRAQLELGRLHCQPRQRDVLQARQWLEQAANQGSREAARLLQRLNP